MIKGIVLVAECPNCKNIIYVNDNLKDRQSIKLSIQQWILEHYKVYWMNHKYVNKTECTCNINKITQRLMHEVY